MKKAIVIGATGMVGTQLVQALIENKEYSEILSLVRRPGGITNPKLTEQVIDFDAPDTWSALVTGDVLFSALGTTIAQAKSKDAQYKVDFTYQYTVAKIASANRVSRYVLVSSGGANAASKAFYIKMKGELENAVLSLPFEVISILRPSILAGNRIQNRPAEKIGIIIMTGLNNLGLLKRYKPIQASIVAKAMIMAAESKQSATYTLDEVFKLAQ
jgi:uncharacterized protein YbjT (DUF2867 family)